MTFLDDVISQPDALCAEGLYRHEESFIMTQAAHVGVPARNVINLYVNNYLGLADLPKLTTATKDALERWGFGTASAWFICGTQTQHLDLEAELTRFLRPGAEGFGTILYSLCFDANGGLFKTLFGAEDVIISDELSHVSIIDEVRLNKAARHRYRNRDFGDLRARLEETRGVRHRVIAIDDVFSMDGYVVPSDEIYALADEYGALVMVDDSHAVGFVGETGADTLERFSVTERVGIITGTLGKAFGGVSGGYTCARSPIAELLWQRSRPYLFSNPLAPLIVAATLAALGPLGRSGELLDRLRENTTYLRIRMAEEGFEIPESDHPIVPVMIGDAVLAACMAGAILACGAYVRAFSYPVVPKGRARIRVQLSAFLTCNDLDAVIHALVEARSEVQ